jgi:hypothetical protein
VTEDKLIPATELKERITQWKLEQKTNRQKNQQ